MGKVNRVSLKALLLLLPLAAFGQSAVLQNGPWVFGHVPVYTNRGAGSPTISDSGPARGGNAGVNPSEFALTMIGSGLPPYAGTGTGPYGTNDCDYDGPSTGTSYHYLCFSPNAAGGGLIVYGAGGLAPPLPLKFIVNGTTYTFPFSGGFVVGPPTTVIGDVACFANAVGTLLSDCGVLPIGANPTASIGNTPVNGSALTFMRSDAAPALGAGTALANIGFGNITPNYLSIDYTTVAGQFCALGSSCNIPVSGLEPIPGDTVVGNAGVGSAVPLPLSQIQLTSLVNVFSTVASGAVPISPGGIADFLRADGVWSTAGGVPSGALYSTQYNAGGVLGGTGPGIIGYPLVSQGSGLPPVFAQVTSAGIANSGVIAGTYTNTSLTVGIDGRLTYAASGTGSGLPTLADGYFWVGNPLAVATPVAMSGDATMSDLGILTLDNVNLTPGSYTFANITVNSKGLVTAAANGAGASPVFTTLLATSNVTFSGLATSGVIVDSLCTTASGSVIENIGANCYPSGTAAAGGLPNSIQINSGGSLGGIGPLANGLAGWNASGVPATVAPDVAGMLVTNSSSVPGFNNSFSVSVTQYGAFTTLGSAATNTATLNAAMAAVSASGGGTVLIPNGAFLLNTFSVPNYVMVSGQVTGPFDAGTNPATTVAAPTLLVNTYGANGFVNLTGINSGISDVVIYDPNQTAPTGTTPIVEPAMIYSATTSAIRRITLVNAYVGLNLFTGRVVVEDMKIGSFSAGMLIDGPADNVYVNNVSMGQFYDTYLTPGTVPNTIDTWVMANGVGMHFGRMDSFFGSNIAIGAKFDGIVFADSSYSVGPTFIAGYGKFTNVDMDGVIYGVDAISTNDVAYGWKFVNMDIGAAAAGAQATLFLATGGVSAPTITWEGGSARGAWAAGSQTYQINAGTAYILNVRGVPNLNEGTGVTTLTSTNANIGLSASSGPVTMTLGNAGVVAGINLYDNNSHELIGFSGTGGGTLLGNAASPIVGYNSFQPVSASTYNLGAAGDPWNIIYGNSLGTSAEYFANAYITSLVMNGNLTTNLTSGALQCVEANPSGVLVGTGAPCGAGGGGVTSVTGSGNVIVSPTTGAPVVSITSSPVFTGAVTAANLETASGGAVYSNTYVSQTSAYAMLGQSGTTLVFGSASDTSINLNSSPIPNLTYLTDGSIGSPWAAVYSRAYFVGPSSSGVAGVNCSGLPTTSFAVTNGIVTHC